MFGEETGMVFTSILGAVNPRVTLDDKRRGQTSSSDVILAYLRAGSLYYRQQRDRYLTEYLLTANPPCGGLATLCMSTGGRLHLALRWSRTLLGDEDGVRLREMFTRHLASTSSETV